MQLMLLQYLSAVNKERDVKNGHIKETFLTEIFCVQPFLSAVAVHTNGYVLSLPIYFY
jgi:hypothetical protein